MTAVTAAAVIGAPLASSAHPRHPHQATHRKQVPATKTAMICPVTGDKIASVQKAVGHSTYKGKTYYFCCSGCKPRFDKSPAKFIKNAAKGKFEKM